MVGRSLICNTSTRLAALIRRRPADSIRDGRHEPDTKSGYMTAISTFYPLLKAAFDKPGASIHVA
uniref:Uncharacterized protein n=1 Tax=Ralstonia syzygii R24 TaxID=907261 RepID=G3A854_9RALS|nr:hypothetical protein RALSY_40237 [Ralstonia syzygii R24]